MEFCQLFETLWNHFLCASRAFRVSMIHAFVHFYVVHWFFPVFISIIILWFIITWISVGFTCLFLFMLILCLYPRKTEIILENSWKNHGIWFRTLAGNPDFILGEIKEENSSYALGSTPKSWTFCPPCFHSEFCDISSGVLLHFWLTCTPNRIE